MLQTENVRRPSEDQEHRRDDDEQLINDDLETFLFENCMTVQEQMYPLIRFWKQLFRHNVVST